MRSRGLQLLSFMLVFMVSLTAAAETEDGSSYHVTVSHDCSIGYTDFEAPGDSTMEPNVIPSQEEDYFWALLYNNGNEDVNVTADVNVTSQPNMWEEGENFGPAIDLSIQNTTYEENHSIPWKVPDSEEPPIAPENDTWWGYSKPFKAMYNHGNYTAHLNVNYSCASSNKTGRLVVHDNFIILDTKGESGGVDTVSNQSTNQTVPEDINNTGDQNATIGNKTGNSTSDVTKPQDVNQTGEESDEPLEGNDDNPGVTPEPEPVPQPVPDPVPMLTIDMQPVESLYHVNQSQFLAATMEITNTGNVAVNDVTLTPEIDQFREGWDIRTAQIANLSVNETVTRDVYVRPSEDVTPGEYVVPVRASDPENDLDLDYFRVKVHDFQFVPRMEILEAPRSINLEKNSNITLPLLVKNTGKRDLTNITANLQNVEDCGSVKVDTLEAVDVNGSKSLSLSVETASKTESCNATLIVSSDQGAYAFSNMQVTVIPEEGLIPPEQRVPMISILWTAVLAIFAVLKRKFSLNSMAAKLPLVLLVIGESVIILYLAANYYGIAGSGILPF